MSISTNFLTLVMQMLFGINPIDGFSSPSIRVLLEVDVFSHRSSAKRYLVRVAVQDASRSPMFVAGIQDENMLGLSAVEVNK
ncbi:hypothetical protein C5167_008699 [Papaver somniferum]|uniref:Uncharacterized protein n=1 Tax=Papaver somniferum TaxID=3469 RepID=A0A4Y7JZ88_PAPSO|nr:hypothetical protein C5167_008699 [Papaver somniferum]